MGLTRPRFSQFDTTISSISDPVTVLNKSSTLANVDVGFVINRNGGALANTAIFWNEGANTFALAFTTNSGELPNANISISEYANLRVNTLTADTATFSSTGAIKIPSGNTAQRTAGTTGQIRFNTSTSQFEGYQGASWSSLGGVRSVDNNTYIIAESSAGAGDNILQFFAGGNRQANLSSAGLTVTANVSAGYFTGNGSQLSGINSFSNVFISGQSPVQADSISDTLTLVGGTGISITANASLDTITIATVSTTGPFAASGDFGAVNDPVTVSEDEGSVADGATITYDLGSIISASGLIYPDQLVLPSYPTASLPDASVSAQLVYNTTANGLAFSDGTNWSNIGASYSNVQVATYLPTHVGTVGATLINSSGNVLSTGLSVFGSINSTGFINTSANISAGGNVTVANLIVSTGAGQFSGQFNESSTTSGVFVGNASPSAPTPRVGFFNGNSTQNWQIDNNFGTFRWFTPGVVRMSLDARGNLSVFNFANINITSGSADSALQIVGNVSRGGAGYHDFLRVTSTASGATNPNKHLRLDGTGNLQIINSAYTGTILSLTDAGILSDGKGDVRSAPQNSQGGAYTLVVGDAGKHISITTGGVTVNASIFSVGDMVTVFNNSGSSQTITQGTSVTLRLAGTATTGNRTLAQYGIATLLCVTGGASPVFACTGAGLT
jgi:hypothetical protein